jgi:phosphoribosylcarboxyaminoimidazole (NCAIR) mutase
MAAQVVIIMGSKRDLSDAQDVAKTLNALALSDGTLSQRIAAYKQRMVDDLAQADAEVQQG